jgi:hypothetical protein
VPARLGDGFLLRGRWVAHDHLPGLGAILTSVL